MLSALEKMMFLKEVFFFKDMTVDQLKVLATVCEEELFPAGQAVFDVGDPGGVLYVIVSGQVGIEQEKAAGAQVRLTTLGAYAYFGEMNLFDATRHTVAAVALQDTLTLCLYREPLIALTRRHSDLLLELVNVLSKSLREAHSRIGALSRTVPRELQRLYDQFE